MAEHAEDEIACVERKLDMFRLYDRNVDLVSVFELLFTESDTAIPTTTAHFERFPSIPVGDKTLTPDFTVLFSDNTALVGELARFARHDNSVDKLYSQLHGYSELDRVPQGATTMAQVGHVDLLLLVSLEQGKDATRRILHDRMLDEGSEFGLQTPLTICQHALDMQTYVVQHVADDENALPNDFDRPLGLGKILRDRGSFKIKAERIQSIKAARSFINDQVDPLYLATHLWLKTFATDAGPQGGERPVPLRVSSGKLAAQLQKQHGTVRSAEVKRALGLLSDARLARQVAGNEWEVAWEEIAEARRRSLHEVLAERSCRRPSSGPVDKLPPPGADAVEQQTSLFDTDA